MTSVIVTSAWPVAFPTNPWLGSDRKLLVEARSHIDRSWSPPIPDGLPTTKGISPSESSWVEHIVEGYYARYDFLNTFVEVSAIRFDDAALATQTPSVSSLLHPDAPAGDRVVFGAVVVKVAGPKSDCLQSVDAYVRSLTR